MEFFATCPKGFEHLLANELVRIGIAHPRPLQGQVSFAGELEAAYRACLWSRLASRVVLVLGRHDARTSDELYEGVRELPWEDHIAPASTFAVDATGTTEQLRTTQFTAVRAKDAVVDRLLAQRGTRAQVDTHNADVTVAVRISRNRALVGIDLVGTPLFKRAYGRSRIKGGLRFDYAAALLELGGWASMCEHATPQAAPSLLVASPNPDSLAVEAALMAAQHAPGLSRTAWGFKTWAGHNEDAWQQLVAEAKEAVRDEACATIQALSWEVSVLQTRATLDSLGVRAAFELVPAKAVESQTGLAEHVSLAAFDLSSAWPGEPAHEASLLSSMANMARATHPSSVAVASRDSLPGAYLQ